MINKATRKLYFDAAHRVVNHEGKCKLLHGHRYSLEVTFESLEKDELGRVLDFGYIKTILGEWIEKNFDHNAILWDKDKQLGDSISLITGQTIYYLPFNPTAENIAFYLLNNIIPDLFRDTGVNCKYLRLYETPNCFVEVDKKEAGI